MFRLTSTNINETITNFIAKPDSFNSTQSKELLTSLTTLNYNETNKKEYLELFRAIRTKFEKDLDQGSFVQIITFLMQPNPLDFSHDFEEFELFVRCHINLLSSENILLAFKYYSKFPTSNLFFYDKVWTDLCSLTVNLHQTKNLTLKQFLLILDTTLELGFTVNFTFTHLAILSTIALDIIPQIGSSNVDDFTEAEANLIDKSYFYLCNKKNSEFFPEGLLEKLKAVYVMYYGNSKISQEMVFAYLKRSTVLNKEFLLRNYKYFRLLFSITSGLSTLFLFFSNSSLLFVSSFSSWALAISSKLTK